MSQASGGEELWQCAACTTSVPLSIGKKFKVCPFCEPGLTTPSKSVTACLPLQTATDAELETSTSILTPRPSPFESEKFTHLAGTEHLTHSPSAEGIIAVNQSDVGATYTDTSNKHIINEYTTENIEKPPNLPGEEVAQGPSNEHFAQGPSNDPPSPPAEHLTQDHTNNLSTLGLAEGDAQLEAGTVEVGSSDQNETSPKFLHVRTATPEADAEQLTSTLNLDASSSKLGESVNFSHLPALEIIARNQSDVGATGTDTETSKENKESTTENTQIPPREKLPQSHSKDPSSQPGENLTRGLSDDPPSPGEEGAEQLKAGTDLEEADISDQNVNSQSEFPGTATPEVDAELVTSTSNLDISTPRSGVGESETTENFTHVAGAEHLLHLPSAEEIIAGNQPDVGATGTDTETCKENKESATEDTQSPLREKLPRGPSNNPPIPPGENLTQDQTNDPPSLSPLGLAEGAAQLEAGTVNAGSGDQDVSTEFPVVDAIPNCSLHGSAHQTLAGTTTTCEYCNKKIFDSSAKYCKGCLHSTEKKDTDFRRSNSNITQLGPPCKKCGENLNVDPTAYICRNCGTPNRQRVLRNIKAKFDSSHHLARTQQQVFGPKANPDPLFHGGTSQSVADPGINQARDGVSQRKRTGSEFELEQSVKLPKVDNGSVAVPTDGQKELAKGDQLLLAPTNDSDAHNHAAEVKRDSRGININKQVETKTSEAHEYRKPTEAEELLPGQGKNVKHAQNIKKTESRRDEIADPSKLRGLMTDSSQPFVVVFHIIIPKPHWEWDKTSKVFLRFGCEELGSWKANVGLFHERYINEDFCELTCRLRIKHELLKNCIPYKYVVFTPKSLPKESNCFEFLHDIPKLSGPYLNRYLQLSQEALKNSRTYDQYDSMAFPDRMRVSTGTSFVNALVSGANKVFSIFGLKNVESGSKTEPLKVLSNFDMRCQCLLLYLEKYRHILLAEFSQETSMDRVIEDVQHIFLSFTKIEITYRQDLNYKETVHSISRELRPLRKLFLDWLQPSVEQLVTLSPEKQLTLSAFIAWCIVKLEIPPKLIEFSSSVLDHLCAKHPAAESQQWEEYNYLCHFTPKASRLQLAIALQSFIVNNIDKGSGIERLYRMPLCNFLSGSSQPYDDLFSYDCDMLFRNWSQVSDKFKLFDVRVALAKNHRYEELYFPLLKDFFELDPIVLQAFVYICPEGNLCALFERIPPHVSTAWLSYIIGNHMMLDVSKDNAGDWVSWLHTTNTTLTSEYFKRYLKPFVMIHSALSFFKRCTTILLAPFEHYIDVINGSLSLIFKSIALYIEINGEKSFDDLHNVLACVRDSLQKWINDNRVVGGPMFGNGSLSWGNQKDYVHLPKCDYEMKVWRSLLTVKCSSALTIEKWHGIVQEILFKRVDRVPGPTTIRLLPFVEDNSEEHQILTNIVMNAAIRAVENVLLRPYGSATESFQQITADHSRLLGNILGTILKKKYHQLTIEGGVNDWITLDVLLDWDLWPNYVKIVQQVGSRLHAGLQPECQIACVCASTKFEEVCTELQQGSISLYDLEKMKTKQVRLRRLCEVVSFQGDGKLSLETVLGCIDKRLNEFEKFSLRKQAYMEICKWMPESIKGITELKKELEQDFKGLKIKDVCQIEGGILKLSCLEAAKPLDSFVDHFGIMHRRSSNMFVQSLNQKKRQMLVHSNLTINDVYPLIWQPIFEQSLKLLNDLATHEITLGTVDDHLKPHTATLKSDVCNLAVGMHECSSTAPDYITLQSALSKVEDYWRICEYRDGAQVFLQLKEELQLSGDFALIQMLASSLKSSMKDVRLASIDRNLVEAGHFLKEILDTKSKMECLKAFVDCQDIIKWLRKSTKNVNDIQGFVTVALATAAGGEDDLASDKLSHLRNVGSGFASLIYGISTSYGYVELMQRCTPLWDSLTKIPNLPKLLVDCNKDVQWYQSVKDTQGSVETTSYGQMSNLLKYGKYRIGFKKSAQTVHDLITITLSRRCQNVVKWKYSLDELRDLESKLVLICGNKAKNRAEVDHYLNLLHSATRIAELYLDLQRAGEVTYTDVSLIFQCAVYNAKQPGDKDVQFNEAKAKVEVTTLQNYIRILNGKLVTWKQNVDNARGKYYELNYFTTLQLLQLRKELGILTQPSVTHTVKPNVLMLLKSISPQVTSGVVIKSLQATTQPEPMISEDNMEAIIPATIDSEVMESTSPACQKQSPQQVTSSPSTAAPLLPSFSYNDLTDEQQKAYEHCIHYLGHSEDQVLRAFDECGKKATIYDIEQWCDDNEDSSPSDEEFSVGTPEREEITYPYGLEDDLDFDDTLGVLSMISQASTTTAAQLEGPVLDCSLQIKTVVRLTVDESDPAVEKLVEAGYEPQDCVEAIEHSMGDVHEAMKLLDARETEEGGQPGMFVRSISREEPIQDQSATDADGENFVEHRGSDASSSHLQLDQLGRVLKSISTLVPGAVDKQRSFNTGLLKAGLPNLLVTAPENVLSSVLALYTGNHTLPLPTQEEVLLCTSRTSTEEVSLLWRRAFGDPEYKRVFCLAHAEKLSYQVCEAAFTSLNELSQGKSYYRLVVICSKEDEDKSYIISRLHNYRRLVVPKLVLDDCREYLKAHFVHQMNMELDGQATPTSDQRASLVDPENSCVRVVSSTRSGMGKSLYVKKKAVCLRQAMSNGDVHVTIPIHGPVVTADTLMDYFKKYTGRENCTIYHLDIAPRALAEVDCILFSLLILSGLSDSRGLVWRSHASHFYMVEVTLPERTSDQEGFQTLHLLNLLPTVRCTSPRDVALERHQQLGAGVLGMDNEEFKGPTIQRVYQYLRRHAGGHNLDTFSYQDGTFEGDESGCLRMILSKCGIKDPSWAEIHHFTKFLDIQLNSCENSVFCDENLVGDVMSGLKGFVVKFMIRMSQDFSTPSLEGVLARDNLEEDVPAVPAADDDHDQLEQYQIVSRRQWEQNSHPYIFFNEDTVSITFVGFMVTLNGDLVDPVHKTVLEPAIMKPQLYTGLKQNKVNFDEDYRGWGKEQMIIKIATVMGFDFLYDPDDTYVLTTDNLIKMLAIQMRFRCDIPVVLMGETGCGKTRLIRYMCNLARGGRDLKNMLILKIHGGVTDLDVTNFVECAEETARTNKTVDPRLSTVVFFDEANTTESIGLIKEVMCDRRVNGRPVSKDIKFIAACNPYRKHSKDMIRKLEAAGLGFYVRETQQKLGKIPLRQLVYRVLELPPSMCPLVYDFGQLNTATEYDYTRQIVMDHIHGHPSLCNEIPAIIPAISAVLAASQKFMRDQKNECSFVSLRDVERAMIVFEYFYEKMESVFATLIANRAEEDYNEFYAVNDDIEDCEAAALPPRPPRLNNVTSALILTVSMCYHARLQDRTPYEKHIATYFNDPLWLPGGDQRFRDEIRWCEEGLLGKMELGPNIAKNAALRENVFMMAICIELRIPLFLVGKPGSSKSLAKSIIQDSMHGLGSRSPLLREFKQVHMFSYQCSQLSTPESVIEVFKSAERFQANQDTKQYVSVVVLDEVGLAEDSPSLPLKALHPLLEDGTEGSGKDHQQQTVEREKRVAFIGISNWALDPAKMNRGVMVTRGDPGKKDLMLSAEGICSNKDSDPIREQLRRYFEPLSEAYMKVCNICEKQKRQFFGLRDFYSLIKMLYWMCERSMCQPLSWPQMQHAICRNFGGLESEEINPLEEFHSAIGYIEDSQDLTGLDGEKTSIRNPDCSQRGLIKTSLNTKDTTWHGENRYLLFLTENYAALDILKHYVGGEGVNDSDLTSQPYILFGSSFPNDKEYTQVCRNINQIKICMETGRTVILLNLENLYESLYDVLNQYYMYYGGVRYVDLGLQTHRVKCRVHDNFKLILIAEKDTVYKKFPTPLINRLEKHFVLTSSVLEDWQSDILRAFGKWIHDFSTTSDFRGNRFSEAHAFIGYQKDTPAAVVFQASNLLNRLQQNSSLPKVKQLQRAGIISENFAGLSEGSPQWSDTVLGLSQFLLLQTAADDAIIRLCKSNLSQKEIKCLTSWYFKYQHHTSIGEFLQYECNHNREVFMQVTTHCPLMTYEELIMVSDAVSMDFAHYDLHEFDSELDFSNKIGPKFLRDDVHDAKPFLVIVQCDSGHLNSELIACARYRVCDEAIRAKTKNKIRGCSNIDKIITHILFVIRLPQQEIKSQFVGFQGDPWISVHIDDLRSTSEITVIPEQALNASISELFIGRLHEGHELQQDSGSQSGIETGQEDSEDEMSHSAEHGQRMSDNDFYSDQDMSDNEASAQSTPQLPSVSSLEEVNSMDTEIDESLFSVPEPTYRHSAVNVHEASKIMDTEDMEDRGDAQLSDPSLIVISFPPVEMTQGDELASDTMQIGLPTNDFTKPIESISPLTPIEYSGDYITELAPRPMNADPVAEVPILDSFEGDVPGQEDKLWTEQKRQVKASRSFHPQHQRLLGCVQAAVSMLKDSRRDRAMHRIQKLMALIPKIHTEELGKAPFYYLLVKFIHSALVQRERDRVYEREWVLNEAMSGRKLQNGGTFRNVLARRIDEVITPYFAEIIAHTDQNSNLDLLDPENLNSPVSRLWLIIFQFTGERIDFSSLAEGKTTIKTDFHCHFPFSWFVKDMVDAQRASMLDLGTEQHLYYSLCEALSLSEVGEILSSVEKDHVDKFYKLYLHDFVRYIHKSSHKSELSNMEYMLIMDALDDMTHRSDFCSVDSHESLTYKIVALHLVHSRCSANVLQFGQLVLYRPWILRSLSNKDTFRRAGEDFTLHLYAVQTVLELDQEDNDPTSPYLAGLNPPLHKPNQGDVTQDLQRWLNHVRLSQNVIDTILRSSCGNDAAIKSRLTWQRIRALQIFTEKVYLPHCKVEGMAFIIRRLELKLKKHSNFLMKVTLDEVKLLLNSMFSVKKLKADNVIKPKMRKSCDRFFIEVVSSLCFGGMEAPEPELVKLLLETVLQDTQTSRLSPYNQKDETPTIRSFLLQLLLEHEPDQVKLYLNEYFERSIEVIKGHGVDQGLFLLCIQCFEDAVRKRVCLLPAQSQASDIGRILEEGYLALQEHLRTSTVSLQYLEAVAGVRLALSVLAQQLKSDRVNNALLRVARDLCMDTRVNVIDPTGRVDTVGPVLYLMKLIVRQFGFPCLQTVSQAHPWVVPEGLRRVDNEEKSIDSFVLYEQGYKDVRNAVNTALFTGETAELATCVQNGAEVYLLAFAFYQKVTLSRASTAPADQIEEALQTLDTFVQNYPDLPPDMLQFLRLLLTNQQGGTLAQMIVSPHQAQASLLISITGLVVHTVAVLLSRANTKLLLPFLNMLKNTTTLKNSYLPTMPEDILQEVRQAGGGTFYECPNGHPYLIGECGEPVEQKTCRECAASIGGIDYQLLTGNKTARMNDTTKTGHDLGAPQQRTVNSERERTLSATAVSIVRALMHASFLWAACHNQQLELIAGVVKGVRPQDLAEFFWLHLEKDLECMQHSTGRGMDECVMIMHLVLREILVTNPQASNVAANVNQLQNKTARKEWERLFNVSYIEPVLNQLEDFMAKALDLVANDDQQEQDRLFYLAYEKVIVDEGKLEAHLWSYRPQINLEHLKSSVQTRKDCKILDVFLEIEPSLRATQYIPDIVRLQKFMFETFDRRLEKSKAATMTIREFLKEVKNTRNENIKNKCQEMIDNLKKAWALVGQKLKNHNRLPVEEKYFLAEIKDKTPLVYLIPTTMREGRCTTALVDYLVLTHNNFIERCRGIVSQGAESASAVWRENKVPITHVHRCHFLEYEQHLQSIILSHCHYSLTVGSGQNIKYDLPALEKHVLNRFIYGKPVVLLDIPCVAYRKDIYTAETFQEIRRKVKPQILLHKRIQQDIVTELRTPDKLKESLDVVDVVLGLLSSGGASYDISLHKYILSRKMGKKPFSAKANEHCTLGHILSLWKTISVELAKQLWHTGQEPFEGIPAGYSADLSTDQLKELNQCLRTFDLVLLLGILFEFIEVHVKHMTANEENFPLVESLALYWDMTEQSPIDLDRLDEFPENITVPQAVATWKHITDYKEKKN